MSIKTSASSSSSSLSKIQFRMDPQLTPALSAATSAAESCEDKLPPLPGAVKLRLMCSYGGHIVPRPHDKALCYVGGDTRMVVVDRSLTLCGLYGRISKTLELTAKPFSLKYQLPNEDLDSLISVAGDEDLENMIEEYDRICAAAGDGGKGTRLRLFLFPAKSESVASIGSILDSSVKSDEWFLSALNGSRLPSGGISDSNSVNFLLGLERDLVFANSNDLGISSGLDSEFGNEKNVKSSNQDVHSVPDSPMMDTASSFGSANSTPSLANLPPIRVREDQRLGIEEKFAQISVSATENFAAMSSTPPPMRTTIIASMTVQPTVPSSALVCGNLENRIVSAAAADDDETSVLGDFLGLRRKPPPQQSQVLPQQIQLKPGPVVDSPRPVSLPSDGLPNATPRSNQLSFQEAVQVSSGERIPTNKVDQRNSLMDLNNAGVQLQRQVQDSGYLVQPQIEPQQYPYQQKFVHAGPHYVIQQPGNPMAMPAYYSVYTPPQQQAQQHPHHQPIQLPHQQYQHPVYIVQAPQPLPQGYNMLQQQTYPETTAVAHAGHPQAPLLPNRVPDNNPNVSRSPLNPEVSSGIYRTTAADAQPMVQAAPRLPQQKFVNSQVNHQPLVTPAPNPNYSYEIPNPAHAQIYLTQPLGPSVISQYQTMSSAQSLEASSQPQNDSMKPPQVRNS